MPLFYKSPLVLNSQVEFDFGKGVQGLLAPFFFVLFKSYTNFFDYFFFVKPKA